MRKSVRWIVTVVLTAAIAGFLAGCMRTRPGQHHWVPAHKGSGGKVIPGHWEPKL